MTATRNEQGRTATDEAPPSPVGQDETIKELLEQSHREVVPVRKTFVQQGRGKNTRPGPLANFLTGHDERGLDAYLLLHALASSKPWNCDFPSGVWVRALGFADHATLPSARGAVSKVMRRLEDKRLIKRGRIQRKSSVSPT